MQVVHIITARTFCELFIKLLMYGVEIKIYLVITRRVKKYSPLRRQRSGRVLVTSFARYSDHALSVSAVTVVGRRRVAVGLNVRNFSSTI